MGLVNGRAQWQVRLFCFAQFVGVSETLSFALTQPSPVYSGLELAAGLAPCTELRLVTTETCCHSQIDAR